jgi:hypothetical protein
VYVFLYRSCIAQECLASALLSRRVSLLSILSNAFI